MKILPGKQLSWLATGLAGLLFTAGPVLADDSTTTTQTAPPLPYGVSDVIQLSQAQVSDGTILTFIRTSGDSYNLNASQIVYLRQQGVSEAVVNAMLTQPKTGTTASDSTPVSGAPLMPPPIPPPVMADAPAPVVCAPPASSVSVYVIPDTATANYNATYYNPNTTWSFYPSVVYIGGGGGWVGSRGGWHGGGGWYHSGGWHR